MRVLILFLLVLMSLHVNAESIKTLGFGYGPSYGGGLGANITFVDGDNSYYMAGGLLGYTSSRGESDSAGGFGLGWNTKKFSNNDKHALGLYLGSVAAESTNGNIDIFSGLAIQYIYHFNSDYGKGLNIGLAPSLGWNSGERKSFLNFQLGYQFQF